MTKANERTSAVHDRIKDLCATGDDLIEQGKLDDAFAAYHASLDLLPLTFDSDKLHANWVALRQGRSMPVDKKIVRLLAEAWGREATDLRRVYDYDECACRCGSKLTTASAYKPGHDSKLRARYANIIEGILAQAE
jgi:hypothetical protein